MYIDDIKLLSIMSKKYNCNIYLIYRNGIWNKKMRHATNKMKKEKQLKE